MQQKIGELVDGVGIERGPEGNGSSCCPKAAEVAWREMAAINAMFE